jgi:hypothetical protein
MELMADTMRKCGGGGTSVNWELPGKRKEGYCKEKDQMLQSYPSLLNAWHKRSLKVVMPPGLSGCAGPMMMILFGG